jgi:alkyldihydroxyacetonephosphate synthase
MASKNRFEPAWFEQPAAEGTYRSLFKWGHPAEFKHPNRRLYALIKKVLDLDDTDFTVPQRVGLEQVTEEIPSRLPDQVLDNLRRLVGDENVQTGTYSRLRASFGKSAIDQLRLRLHIIENLPDAVVCPRSREDIRAIVALCDAWRLPVYVFGAGSGVTRGAEAVKGGVTLDMSTHMQRVLAFNEIDQTITVEAGLWGPQLEEALHQAPERFGAHHRYTCGHFPQSFEFSSVGGWVVTRGAGQNSTYYGKIEDLVIAQDYVTPAGDLITLKHPRAATGPDLDQVMIGSEGAFGVLVSVTLRVFRAMPENHKRFSYLFRDWAGAVAAVRELMQSEAGYPSVFRLSDAEETDVAMVNYGIAGTPVEKALNILGYQPGRHCLLVGMTAGERGFSRHLNRVIRRVCRRQGALDLSLLPITQKWEESRFRDPYLREALGDYGILINTLECGVTWSEIDDVYQRVRQEVKNRPRTICMGHISHMYPQGANLYFIFIAKIDSIAEYLDFQYSIQEGIQQSGAALSHHHGIGKQTAPWLAAQLGEPAMALLRALKHHFDPNGIMNPGGTLGLDLTQEQIDKKWGKSLEG